MNERKKKGKKEGRKQQARKKGRKTGKKEGRKEDIQDVSLVGGFKTVQTNCHYTFHITSEKLKIVWSQIKYQVILFNM